MKDPPAFAARNSLGGLRATGCARVYPPAWVEVVREYPETETNHLVHGGPLLSSTLRPATYLHAVCS
jgi:hypothetical protein